MNIAGNAALVTGGASGLGLASAKALIAAGAHVVIADLPRSAGEQVAGEIGARFAPADVTEPEQVAAALELAGEAGPVRAVVHCAGIGDIVRVVERDGSPGSLAAYRKVIDVNQIGSFNVLTRAAAAMAASEPVDGERGTIVLTASIAAFEGQIGQIAYSASKAAVHGMTLVAARDLAARLIRVNTIAPGLFDTPLLASLPEPARESLGRSVPNPSRLGDPAEYGQLALAIIANQMLNGETIRLDGALRMAPR